MAKEKKPKTVSIEFIKDAAGAEKGYKTQVGKELADMLVKQGRAKIVK